MDSKEFAPRLIAWQAEQGRHGLPWQQGSFGDPYRVWLSEIMLQQTQVATVIPYYQRFLEAFPDVYSLANAPADTVMALWSGLGYYARARNLHRCAQVVVERGGAFPDSVTELAELPGIGRSTAAAIAAFAFGARAAILDANVKRVLTRVFGIEGVPSEKAVENVLWTLAESLLPDTGIGAYTQGLMDLGATLCVGRRPHCMRCPFKKECVAHLSGREHVLPQARVRKAKPTRYFDVLVLRSEDRVLLELRPPVGIWGGLWSLPEAKSREELEDYIATLSGFDPTSRTLGTQQALVELTALAPIAHEFTHFRKIMQPYYVSYAELDRAQLHAQLAPVHQVEQTNTVWVPLQAIGEYGLPAPIRKLLEALNMPIPV